MLHLKAFILFDILCKFVCGSVWACDLSITS